MPSLQDDEYLEQTIESLFKQETKNILYSIIMLSLIVRIMILQNTLKD